MSRSSVVVWGVSLIGNSGTYTGPNEEMSKQMLMNRQLDYDLARLKNCGELKKYGIEYHPESPMSYLCADVIVVPLGE